MSIITQLKERKKDYLNVCVFLKKIVLRILATLHGKGA